MAERCEELVVALSEGSMLQRIQAAELISTLLSTGADAQARFVRNGAIPALVGLLHVLLHADLKRAQCIVTLSLIKVMYNNDEYKAAIVAGRAVPLIVKLLEQAQSKEKNISQLEEFTHARVEASGIGESSGYKGLRVPNSKVEQQLKEAKKKEQWLEQQIKEPEEEIHRLAEERLEDLQAIEAAALEAKIHEYAVHAAVLALFFLSSVEVNKICIGSSRAIPLLLDQLLTIGAKPIYELILLTLSSLVITTPLNGHLVVRAGGILILMQGLRSKKDMPECILRLLRSLAGIEDGLSIIVETPNAIADLVDILETSRQTEKEIVVNILYLLCMNSLSHTRLVQNAGGSAALMAFYLGEMETPVSKIYGRELDRLFASQKQTGETTSHVE